MVKIAKMVWPAEVKSVLEGLAAKGLMVNIAAEQSQTAAIPGLERLFQLLLTWCTPFETDRLALSLFLVMLSVWDACVWQHYTGLRSILLRSRPFPLS